MADQKKVWSSGMDWEEKRIQRCDKVTTREPRGVLTFSLHFKVLKTDALHIAKD